MNKKLIVGIIATAVVAVVVTVIVMGLLRNDSSPVDDTQPAVTKSDTEQIIDTTLAFIVAIGETESPWDYWYGDFDAYRAYRHDGPDINWHVLELLITNIRKPSFLSLGAVQML